ncbi:MAG: PD-(D/E)XK nuclease family protein [Cryobacterium sp.]|nr:PD-(D/E)XK nuclease family protein [Oligoflexia bacterium]
MRFSPKLNSLFSSVDLSGLDPDAWIIVEGGVSREEVKEKFLQAGTGFTSLAIQDLTSLCRWILGPLVDAKRVLGAPSRQEVLRRILSDREFVESMPQIRRLKRQRDFYKKLDLAVGAARMTYVSPLEREVQEERLAASMGPAILRVEMLVVIDAYEAWLTEHTAWDLPRLLLAAMAVLDTPEIPLDFPNRLLVLSATKGESRSEAFFEALGRRTQMERVFVADLLGTDFSSMERADSESALIGKWESWHTVDDACDRVGDALLHAYRSGELEKHGVLLPDLPAIRRSLKRSLAERGLLLKDPRDPTRLKWEESVKVALLPLEVVAKRFRYEEVLSFLHSNWVRLDAVPEVDFEEKRRLHQDVLDRGIRFGLESYTGEKLERLRASLGLLNDAFSARISISETAAFHLAWIRRNEDFEAWVHEFFTSVWERFEQDLAVLGDAKKKAPVLYWLERLKLRLADATPPFEKIQMENGVEIFRLGQTPLKYPEKLWCLALPPRYTTSDTGGDYFYSDREREILSGQFLVRSSYQDAEFRRKVLKFWILHADEVVFLDALYDWDGRERESLEPILQELGLKLECEPKYSYPRWRASYLHPHSAPPRQINLPPFLAPEIRASDLEAFSRCELQGLVLGRWRARDSRPSDLDIRGDSRGTLLHEAVRILMEVRSPEGSFGLTARGALDLAWEKRRPKGLFQGEKLAHFTKRKLVPILDAFMAAEKKYVQRSGTSVLALENPKLKYTVDFGPREDSSHRSSLLISGVPDRIDSHPDGIFIIDYKSGTDSPNAVQMTDLGYRLQMPIYALAAANYYERPVIGLQFVTLNRDATRARGIFFKQWNGKTAGSLTESRANNASLIDSAPDEVWGKIADQIEVHARRFVSGEILVKPKQTKPGQPYAECDHCFIRDACGQRRFLDDVAEEEGE